MKSLSGVLEDHYTHLECLHEGASITTYAARDNTHQAVIIKMLDLKKMRAWKVLELFERETQVLKNLSHAAIPEYVDAFTAIYEGAEYSCLVQRRVAGQTLEAWIQSGHRFNEEDVVSMAKQLLNVLMYLHQLNPPVVHRDIKPANLIWHNGQLYLLDFGGVLKNLGPQQSTIVGTYGYMAPEQFQGKARIESDLYSTGMTLAHLISHVHPSEMGTRSLAVDVSSYVANSSLRGWLQKITQFLPEHRFSTAEIALNALEESLASTGDSPRMWLSLPTPPPAQPEKYSLERTDTHTRLVAHRNPVSTQTALKLDLFITLPGLAVMGLLKVVGYSWLQAALLPSLVCLPLILFLFLAHHYQRVTLERTRDGIRHTRHLGSLKLRDETLATEDVNFQVSALGASQQRLPTDPDRPAALLMETDAGKLPVHMGLSFATYAYIIHELNQEPVGDQTEAVMDREMD